MPRYSPLSHHVGLVVGFSLVASFASAFAEERYGSPAGNIAVYLDNLVRSYPDWIAACTDGYLTMKNGVKFAISDHLGLDLSHCLPQYTATAEGAR
jgi:hypothetical protein